VQRLPARSEDDLHGGLGHLSVLAVGHVTAMIVAALGGSLLVWRRSFPARSSL